jgi:hypothetical protein
MESNTNMHRQFEIAARERFRRLIQTPRLETTFD